MTNEIKLEKRKPTFDYILNDLAFDSLKFRVVNGIGSSQDKFDFDYQIKLIQKEISRLRQNKTRALDLLNEPQFELDNIPCNYENDIEKLKNILRGDE